MHKFLPLLLVLLINMMMAQVPLFLEGETFFEGVYHMSGDTTGTSDVWAWTSADGEEYILAGVKDGTAIIRSSDMEHLQTIPGPTIGDYYYHRDIKTYKHYAYVSSEMRGVNEGIQVIDLSGLPDTAIYLKSLTDQTITSHNLSIDTVNFRAYITGSTFEGVYVYDLFDPKNPIAVSYLPETNVHDVFARNDTIWVANSFDYSIWHMIDPSNPELITRLADTAFGYCHNIWPSKDGRHFVTSEETSGKTVKIWSLDSIGNTALVSEFNAPCELVHNAQVEGDYLYLSYYTSGVYVIDISDPTSPVAIAQYDTYPLNDSSAFYGCWGVFPHSTTGSIYASNFEGKVQKFRSPLTTNILSDTKNLSALLFPNPGISPEIGFRLHAAGETSIQWLDAQGQLLHKETQSLSAGDHRIGIDATSWPTGAYVYRLETGEGVASGTWIKQN